MLRQASLNVLLLELRLDASTPAFKLNAAHFSILISAFCVNKTRLCGIFFLAKARKFHHPWDNCYSLHWHLGHCAGCASQRQLSLLRLPSLTPFKWGRVWTGRDTEKATDGWKAVRGETGGGWKRAHTAEVPGGFGLSEGNGSAIVWQVQQDNIVHNKPRNLKNVLLSHYCQNISVICAVVSTRTLYIYLWRRKWGGPALILTASLVFFSW